MKFKSDISTLKMKVYHCSSPHYMITISETDLILDNTIFSFVFDTWLESHASTAI